MSTTTPRHSARPAREPARRRTWPWLASVTLVLIVTGYLWSHVLSG